MVSAGLFELVDKWLFELVDKSSLLSVLSTAVHRRQIYQKFGLPTD